MKFKLQNKTTLTTKVDESLLPPMNIRDLYRIFTVNDESIEKIGKGESIGAESLGYADTQKYGLGSLGKRQ